MGKCLRVLYANGGMVREQDSECLYNTIKVLIGPFRKYGLVANVTKSQKMTCQPGSLWLDMTKEAVGSRCTGLGWS